MPEQRLSIFPERVRPDSESPGRWQWALITVAAIGALAAVISAVVAILNWLG